MRKSLLNIITCFIALLLCMPLAAQEKLSDKTIAVPTWLNKAVIKANQAKGGHHVYVDWTDYTNKMKTSRVELGMLMTVFDSDGLGNMQTYNLKVWANTADIPLQREWESIGGDASSTNYDNINSGLMAENVQTAIDELKSMQGTPAVIETEMRAIESPADSDMVFCTDCSTAGTLMLYYNGAWIILGNANAAPLAQSVNFSGVLKLSNTLTGTYTYSDSESDPESGTTFKWYRADDIGGNNQVAIAGATSATYNLEANDVAKFIAYAVIPAASSGTPQGAETLSAYQGVIADNELPLAQSVNFSGTIEIDNTLTGIYTYSDTESDPESGTTFKWYRADDATGNNLVVIAGATNATYDLGTADIGKFIAYAVIPASSTGSSPGAEILSVYQGPITENRVPEARNVTLIGNLKMNKILSATYYYYDTDNDTEGASTFSWYRANDASGTGATLIATTQSYTLVLADVNKYIAVAITPVAIEGKSPGIEWFSNYEGPVVDDPWMTSDLPEFKTYDEALIACPPGYHLPTIQEWDDLIAEYSPEYDVVDAMGFPISGYVHGDGRHLLDGLYGIYWSSTVINGNYLDYQFIKSSETVRQSSEQPEYKLSVRCIRD